MTEQIDRGKDLDTMTELAWKDFRRVLAEALDALPDGDAVRITMDVDTDDEGVAPYVRTVREEGFFVVRAPDNRLLADAHRLTTPTRRRMRDLGLVKAEDGAPERCAKVAGRRVDEAAHLVMTVFRDVYGVIHPAFLTSDDVTLPGHTDEAAGTVDGDRADDGPPAVYPVDREHLDHLIDEALTPLLGHAPERDDDGDIPICSGSAVVYIRSHGRNPVIRLFSEMVVGVTDQDAALHEVDVLNRDVAGVKFTRRGDRVIATADVLALPFAADHLHRMLERVCEVVRRHDTDLSRRTGGRVFMDAPPTPEGPDADADADSGGAGGERCGFAGPEDDGIHPVMLAMLELEAECPGTLKPRTAAKMCGYDSDLLLQLIRWNSEQEIAWRIARDEALEVEDDGEAEVCEIERAAAEHTVTMLRKALRRVLLG